MIPFQYLEISIIYYLKFQNLISQKKQSDYNLRKPQNDDYIFKNKYILRYMKKDCSGFGSTFVVEDSKDFERLKYFF